MSDPEVAGSNELKALKFQPSLLLFILIYLETGFLSVEIRLMGSEEAAEEDKKLVKEALREYNAKLTKCVVGSNVERISSLQND